MAGRVDSAAAASSADDIPNQLAVLLGTETVRFRKTDEPPARVSVIDVAVPVTGHDAKYASQAVRNVGEKYPDVHEQLMDVKCSDARGRKGQKKAPVVDVKGRPPEHQRSHGASLAKPLRQQALLIATL